MAAPGRHVGRFIQRNGRLLVNNLEQTCSHRSKEAVLEALAATVSRDPTAYPYQFQDDSYLAPRTSLEFVRRHLHM
ncbi:Pentatricopeptide repeat domain-containing protein 3, mitochondrial [Collichthys lucidus]|uniref:Pentatricopeptide repeat domain-containing protein 3, mitochondrial n=1 Tax=Collichthys lucidus TaxID=240159 RepID=A0A4U5UDY0_COLLU|nr:Pentatricopeptide repeat domain-containing protein 3, mitochondrial [Collichthys lucidus]